MNDANNSWSEAFRSLISEPTSTAGKIVRINPRPPGVIRRGSTTHLLWEHVAQCPGRLFEAGELQVILSAHRGAISFSLGYLEKLGLLEVVQDTRNSRYRLYRLKRGAHASISEPLGVRSDPSNEGRLVRDAKTLPQPQESRMEPIRGGWYRDLPTMGESRSCSPEKGTTPHPKRLAWEKRRDEPPQKPPQSGAAANQDAVLGVATHKIEHGFVPLEDGS